jgi:glycosyltransferase involved in cell wall biosynthesis
MGVAAALDSGRAHHTVAVPERVHFNMATQRSDATPFVTWRLELLPGSETFVRTQADNVPGFAPHYVGVKKVRSAISTDADRILYESTATGRAARNIFLARRRSGRLDRLMQELNPKLVHAHFAYDAAIIAPTLERLGIPLVVTLHGYDVSREQLWRRHGLMMRNMFSRAAYLLAVSNPIREAAIARGADPSKVLVHHLGVSDERALGTTYRDIDVLFVGRLVPKKGGAHLLEALTKNKFLRTAKTVIVGDGPERQRLENLALSQGLNVEFAGAQPPAEVRSHMSRARLLAVPSHTAPDGDMEGLPTVILEAALAECPVVGYRHSGINEAVEPGRTGSLVAEGDVNAFSITLAEMLANDSAVRAMGRRARVFVQRNFNSETQGRALSRIYDGVIAKSEL